MWCWQLGGHVRLGRDQLDELDSESPDSQRPATALWQNREDPAALAGLLGQDGGPFAGLQLLRVCTRDKDAGALDTALQFVLAYCANADTPAATALMTASAARGYAQAAYSAMPGDAFNMAVSAAMVLVYYLLLVMRTRRDPTSSIHGVNVLARTLWVTHVMANPSRDVMAVQTLQDGVTREWMRSFHGREVEVLFEGVASRETDGPPQLMGRLPENVKVNVPVQRAEDLADWKGRLGRVRIERVHPHSLTGELVSLL